MEEKKYIEYRDFCVIKVHDCMIPRDYSCIHKMVDSSNLIKSIKTFGVITPVLVEQLEVGYKILEGRRRIEACEYLGIKEIPAIVMYSDISPDVIWFESKLTQESISELRHSEIASLIYTFYSGVKSQGRRSDLTEDKSKHDSYRMGEEKFQLKRRTISRYLRLYTLCEGLKRFLDEGVISVRSGVELSYLKQEEQWSIFDLLCTEKQNSLSMEKCIKLRKYSSAGIFTKFKALCVIVDTEQNCHMAILRETYKKYRLDKLSDDELRGVLEEAFTSYFSKCSNHKVTWYGT